MSIKNIAIIVTAILTLGIVAGCSDNDEDKDSNKAGISMKDLSPLEKEVVKLSSKRWAIKKAEETDKLYAFLPPSKKAITDEKKFYFSRGTVITYLDARVDAIKCVATVSDEIDSCEVQVAIEYVHKQDKIPGSQIIKETWIKEDGDWWFNSK